MRRRGAPSGRRRGGPSVGEKHAWVRSFLQALRNYGNVRMAAERAGVSFGVPYRHRANCARFRRQWEQALIEAVQLLEAVAWKTATTGNDNWEWKPLRVELPDGTVTTKFERLPLPPKVDGYVLVKLLQAHAPEKYLPRQAMELSGPDKGPVEVVAQQESTVIVIPAMGSDPEASKAQAREMLAKMEEDKRKAEA